MTSQTPSLSSPTERSCSPEPRGSVSTRASLARYNVNGSLDEAFGAGGKAIVAGFTGVAYGVAVQPDGKILVSGSPFALVRFNGDGALDAAFGKEGKVAVAGFGATALIIQPDRKIVVGGVINTESGTGDDFAVVRVNGDGSLDKTFGSSGMATTDFFGSGDVAFSVALQPDGRIVAGGYAANSLSVGPYFGVARYTSEGIPDSTFSGDGRTTTDLPGFDEVAFGIAVQSDGKILAAGEAFGASFYDFAVVRYTSEGAEDPTFGVSGRVTTDFFGRNDGIRGVVVQPNGSIVAAGGAQDETTGYFALTRYSSTVSGPAPEGCPHSKGFWKKHDELWPVRTLTLGSQSYSGAELLRILSSPVKGDASILLAREVIAAKFNIAAGSGSPEVAADVALADGLLVPYSGKLPYNVRTASGPGKKCSVWRGVWLPGTTVVRTGAAPRTSRPDGEITLGRTIRGLYSK